MIGGCAERMRAGDCGACERADPCRQLFAWMARETGERRRPSANPLLDFLGFMAMRAMARRAERPSPARKPKPAFSRRVEAELERELAAGAVGIQHVAHALGTSRQTLYRRLKAEGVTFAGLLDRVRRRLAERLLREEGLSVKETAYRLGFSDPAAFSRAFKRWTGRNPSEMGRRGLISPP